MSIESSSLNVPGPVPAPAVAAPEPVAVGPVSAKPAAGAWRFLLREPLVHFLLAGALIFAVNAWWHPPKKDDRTIVVTKALRKSFVDNFDEDKSRVPSEEQLKKMIDAWVASEILYREGKAMAVDRGDDMIRDRIAYKLQLLIFDQVKVDKPTDEQLRGWFEANHGHFDEPERIGFYLTPPTDEATARRQFEDIKAERETPELQNQTRAILARPVDTLAAGFGAEFRDALLAQPLGQWSVVRSKDGWHVVRVDSRRPGHRAKLDDVRDEAIRLWHNDEVRKRAWEAVNRLKTQYTIKYEQ